MKLQSVFIRFYKSFNYHYTRKLERSDPSKRIAPREWEFVGDKFYPHVEVPIDGEITTVVGANESGKSHLLSAIEAGIKGDSESSSIERTDFCRYSHFFRSVDDDVPRYPDFGFHWSDLTAHERKRLKDLCKDKGPKREEDVKSFYFFRAKDRCTIYVPEEVGSQVLVGVQIDVPPDDLLPPVFRIDSRIALPERVSIHDLARGRKDEGGRWPPLRPGTGLQIRQIGRRHRGIDLRRFGGGQERQRARSRT